MKLIKRLFGYIGIIVWVAPIMFAGYMWGSTCTYFRTGSMIARLGTIDAITAALTRSKFRG